MGVSCLLISIPSYFLLQFKVSLKATVSSSDVIFSNTFIERRTRSEFVEILPQHLVFHQVPRKNNRGTG